MRLGLRCEFVSITLKVLSIGDSPCIFYLYRCFVIGEWSWWNYCGCSGLTVDPCQRSSASQLIWLFDSVMRNACTCNTSQLFIDFENAKAPRASTRTNKCNVNGLNFWRNLDNSTIFSVLFLASEHPHFLTFNLFGVWSVSGIVSSNGSYSLVAPLK